VFPEVVHGKDVGMAECGDGLGLLLKTAKALGVAGERGREDFDGDVAIEAGVAGSVDLTHASCSKRCEDFIGPSLAPEGRGIVGVIIAWGVRR